MLHTSVPAGIARGIAAEMIAPFRHDDYSIQRVACHGKTGIPPPPIAGGGMVQSLQRKARRRGGGQ